MKNTYQSIYASGQSIRRYPEADVVAFATKLKKPKVLMDFGTGTGRNLLPLIQHCITGGLVVGSDLASTGIQNIARWIKSSGGIEIGIEYLSSKERQLVDKIFINSEKVLFFYITRRLDVSFIGPVGIFPRDTSNTDTVLVCLDNSDMANPNFNHNTADAIINRGNIMYLDSEKIPLVVEKNYQILKPNGSLFLSVKSKEDTRFKTCEKIQGFPNRRKQTSGPQKGLEMEFHDKQSLLKLIQKFNLVKLCHVISDDQTRGEVFADYTAVLQKPSIPNR